MPAYCRFTRTGIAELQAEREASARALKLLEEEKAAALRELDRVKKLKEQSDRDAASAKSAASAAESKLKNPGAPTVPEQMWVRLNVVAATDDDDDCCC